MNIKEIESLKELQKIIKTATECSFNIKIDRKNVNIILETRISKYIEGFKMDESIHTKVAFHHGATGQVIIYFVPWGN